MSEISKPRIRFALKAAAIALCLLGQDLSAQQTAVDVPIAQARNIARQAFFAGDTALALEIGRALAKANPNDREAQLLVAAAAPRTGAPTEGREAGVRAYRLAQNDAQRYEAARLTASAAVAEERFTLATFWLRRALTVVTNEADRTQTLRDARAVSQANPWSTNLSFSLVPSNNVNGGAEDAEISAPGTPSGTLSADALALKGLRATLNFQTEYRLFQSPQEQGKIALRYQGARVKLKDNTVADPKNEGETVTLDARDYQVDLLEVSLGYDRSFATGVGGVEFGVGALDFGGERYYDFQRLSFSRSFPVSESAVLFLASQREWLDYTSENIAKARRTNTRVGLSQQLENGDRFNVIIGRITNRTESVNNAKEEWLVQLGYDWAEQMGPLSVSLDAGYRRTEYADYRLLFPVSGGRQDRTFFYNADIGFPNIEYAGFTPTLSISGTRANSNVSRFTTRGFSVALEINSSF